MAELTEEYCVTEGVIWHYHLSHSNDPSHALCGAKVMRTGIKFSDWKMPFGEHFPTQPTYCKKCEQVWLLVETMSQINAESS